MKQNFQKSNKFFEDNIDTETKIQLPRKARKQKTKNQKLQRDRKMLSEASQNNAT